MSIAVPPYYSLAELFDLTSSGELTTFPALITPDFARDALEINVINRPLNEWHVKELMWDIDNGLWKTTHQGLGFNRARHMPDGQHRCTAVVRTNKSIVSLVTFNLEIDYYAPIDTGDVRQPRHQLGLTMREQAVARALITLERPVAGRIPRARIAEAIRLHREGIDWANEAFPYARGVTAPVIAAHVFAYPVAQDTVRGFAAQYVARTASNSNDPTLALRRLLERAATSRTDARLLALAALRCLQAYEKGQTLARVSLNDNGLQYFADKRAAKGL
jgi:hypothetical protein